MTTTNKLKVQLVRSPIGTKQSHRDTVRGLGLRRVNSQRTLEDKIAYLVKIL
jgi:large subunit ribosomal protein L30